MPRKLAKPEGNAQGQKSTHLKIELQLVLGRGLEPRQPRYGS
jgi:hypothetical protein